MFRIPVPSEFVVDVLVVFILAVSGRRQIFASIVPIGVFTPIASDAIISRDMTVLGVQFLLQVLCVVEDGRFLVVLEGGVAVGARQDWQGSEEFSGNGTHSGGGAVYRRDERVIGLGLRFYQRVRLHIDRFSRVYHLRTKKEHYRLTYE